MELLAPEPARECEGEGSSWLGSGVGSSLFGKRGSGVESSERRAAASREGSSTGGWMGSGVESSERGGMWPGSSVGVREEPTAK